jgi:hypothetical protein
VRDGAAGDVDVGSGEPGAARGSGAVDGGVGAADGGVGSVAPGVGCDPREPGTGNGCGTAPVDAHAEVIAARAAVPIARAAAAPIDLIITSDAIGF